jgi:hypothetical protein
MRRKARHTSRRYKREDETIAFSAPLFIRANDQPEAEMFSSNDLVQSPSNNAPETFNNPNLGTAEQAGLNAEQAGATAEQAGVNAEQAGATAEQAGVNAEQVGAGAEQAGVNAEQAGATAEQAGVNAEQAGATAEQVGAGAEQAGANAEQAGANAEQAGANAEQGAAGAAQNLETDLSSRERHSKPNRFRGNVPPGVGASMSVVAEISGYESERVFVADTSMGRARGKGISV